MATKKEIDTTNAETNGAVALFGDEGFMKRDALESFDPKNIAAFLTDLGLSPEEVAYRSSEFTAVDKNDLTGVPLFFIEWEHKPSVQYGGLYALVFGIRLDTNEKIVFADGGVGISQQLMEVTADREKRGYDTTGQTHGLHVQNGLRRSDYEANDVRPAGTTYYLA